jgi:acyl-CoA thioesterase-1
MIRFLVASLVLIQLVASAPKKGPFKEIEDVDGLPRVLLIGDSISIGYTLQVRELLKGRANVHRPPVNCAATIHGLKGLDEWLAIGGKDKKWDVIHFNWGLHDLKYMGPNGENLADPKAGTSKQQVGPEAYEKNLRELVKRLRKTGARLIWRNTTPVPEGARGRVPGHAAEYNEIAAKVMKEMEVEIHDLYSFAKKNAAKIQRKADVHYTREGSMKLAEEVVKVLAIK